MIMLGKGGVELTKSFRSASGGPDVRSQSERRQP